jgi:hypothetical protein
MPSAVGPAWTLRIRYIPFAFLALAIPAHAQSVVFTYDQWERLSAGLKEIYIPGAIDAIFTIAVPAQASTEVDPGNRTKC